MRRPVRLGRVFRCSVCGSEILVINAGSQALDPHCCNISMEPLEACVPIYRCEVCGAEVAALRHEGGTLELVCCHQPMVLREVQIPEAA